MLDARVRGPARLSAGGIRRPVFGPKLTRQLYLIVPLVVLFVINIIPLVYTTYLTFCNWVLYRSPTPPFSGLVNWIEMLTSGRFWHSLQVELVFVAAAVGVEFLLGLAIALLLNRKIIGLEVIRSLFIFPMVLPPIIAAFLWRFMLQSDIGVINYYLRFVGWNRAWLATGPRALGTLVVVDVWQYTPFVALLLLAGLQHLPQDIFEAAQVDGADGLRRFRYVTLPLLMPTIFIVLLLRIIDALKVFPTIYVLTSGGPGIATEALNYLAFLMAFDQSRMGYGATLSMMVMVLSVLIAALFIVSRNKLAAVD
jgi:multiple sugar transport system permease protein